MNQLNENTKKVIDQTVKVIRMLSNSEYSQSIDLFGGSSVGKHIRHIHDFFKTIVDGCDCGQLDYSKRERSIELETNPAVAENKIQKIQKSLQVLDQSCKINIVTDSQNDRLEQIIESTIGREIMYGVDHAIHHLAMIKMVVQIKFPHVNLSEDIGMAPSTLRFQKSRG